MANPDFDEIQTSTLAHHRGTLQENFFCQNPFWDKLKARSKQRIGGGESIEEEIRYAGNEGGGWYQGYETLDTSPFKNLTKIRNGWSQHAAPVSLCGQEECVNMGAYRVISLLENKIDSTEKSVQAFFNNAVINNDGRNAKAIHGLALLISDKPYGGIDPSVPGCEFWVPTLDDAGFAEYVAGGGVPADFPGKPLTWNDLDDVVTCIQDCSDKPDCIMMSKELYMAFKRDLQARGNLMQSAGHAAMGFESFSYQGIDTFYDKQVPEGCVYVLNTRQLTLWCCNDRFMKFRPFITPHNQDSRVSQLFNMLQLTTNERRAHAKLSCRKPFC